MGPSNNWGPNRRHREKKSMGPWSKNCSCIATSHEYQQLGEAWKDSLLQSGWSSNLAIPWFWTFKLQSFGRIYFCFFLSYQAFAYLLWQFWEINIGRKEKDVHTEILGLEEKHGVSSLGFRIGSQAGSYRKSSRTEKRYKQKPKQTNTSRKDCFSSQKNLKRAA